MDTAVEAALAQHPFPLVFASLGGSHLFGFANEHSDYDVHGLHLMPVRPLLTLEPIVQTVRWQDLAPTNGVDGSTHELCKYVMLLLKSNGNYLEILYAPEVLVTTPLHHEIRELARGCFTRLLGEHYRGMAQNQQRGMRSNTLKSLLHHYRCLLMGIHVLRTGELEPNVYRLGELYGEEGLRELADIKRAGGMHPGITADDVTEHGMRLARLEARLAEEEERSALPREPSATTHRAFNDLLERVRLEQLGVRTGRRDA